MVESPFTHKLPISPRGTGSPASSTIATSYPGTGTPDDPGRTRPGRFDRKMWSTSVVPIPSRISRLKRSIHRRYTSAGRASPADTQRRKEERSNRDPTSFTCSIAAYSVGTPKNRVGRSRSRVSNTASGVGRPGRRTASAPTRIGKYKLFPRPYAKNSFAAEKVTSDAVIPRTSSAYESEQTSMSRWRWTAPFGNPVEPDEYSQKAGSSFEVSAQSQETDASATHLSYDVWDAGAEPTTTTCARCGADSAAAPTSVQRGSETTRTLAALSSKKYR